MITFQNADMPIARVWCKRLWEVSEQKVHIRSMAVLLGQLNVRPSLATLCLYFCLPQVRFCHHGLGDKGRPRGFEPN